MKPSYPFVPSLALAAALTFAGSGASPVAPQDERPAGEGNIPIGRMSEPVVGQATVELRNNGATLRTFVRDGEFRFPHQNVGVVEITVRPVNRLYRPYTFTTVMGQEQSYIANVRPIKLGTNVIVRGFTSDLTEGQIFRIGDTIDLNVRVDGVALMSVAPSVWVSGGIGRLSPDDKFTATARGNGQIVIELMGRKQVYNIRVQ
jgi:hypothetical protein